MDALVNNAVEIPIVGVYDTADSEPVRDTAFTTCDTLTSDTSLDIRGTNTDFDEPFSEEIGGFTPTKVAFSEQPQI
jgi:hypothetical protein